jgi:PAS domain S-box-containing protein
MIRAEPVLHAAPDAMVIVDAKGTIVLANLQTEKLFACDHEELIGQPVDALIPGFRDADLVHRSNSFQAADAHPAGADLTLQALRKDGEEVPVEISLSPLETDQGTLDVSRIVSGSLHLTVQSVTLAPVVEAALDTVRFGAEAKFIQLQVVLDSSEVVVAGDHARLQQVVWNLLSNAVKYTPTGDRILVWLEYTNSVAQLTVKVSARGIEAAFLPFVFDRFRQADSSTTRAIGGLGLGLAIVRHLVELHGGTLDAHSDAWPEGARGRGRSGNPRPSEDAHDPASEDGRIPAVALTAFARAEDWTRALLAGFQSHLAKPAEPIELLASSRPWSAERAFLE